MVEIWSDQGPDNIPNPVLEHVYEYVCELLGTDVKSDNTIHRYTTAFETHGILDSDLTGRGRNKGMYKQYRLNRDAGLLIETIMENDESLEELFDDRELISATATEKLKKFNSKNRPYFTFQQPPPYSYSDPGFHFSTTPPYPAPTRVSLSTTPPYSYSDPCFHFSTTPLSLPRLGFHFSTTPSLFYSRSMFSFFNNPSLFLLRSMFSLFNNPSPILTPIHVFTFNNPLPILTPIHVSLFNNPSLFSF